MTDKTTRIFLYGTLRHAPLLTAVAGEPVSGQAAVLPGFCIRAVADGAFPLIAVDPKQDAPGLLIEVSEDAARRINFYETGFHYAPAPVEITVGDRAEAALTYLPEPGRWEGAGPWSLNRWIADHGEVAVATAEDYMALEGDRSPEDAALSFAQIQTRAVSRLRARTGSKPVTTGAVPKVTDIKVAQLRRPYVNYFAVREEDLTFPRFEGGSSKPVTRAAFMGGDAVTVLPYDANTDSVLVIRQFRYGAYARGDAQPWCLEPIAGRVDAGEAPKDAARREAREEARLDLGDLHLIGRYYPSPAAFSEFIYSYAAPADLTGMGGGVTGAATEDEDIQSIVMTLDDLLDLIETGEADTGPLLLSALWLARRRDALHARH